MKIQALIFIRKMAAAFVLLAFCLLFVSGAALLPGLAKLASFQIGPAILAKNFAFLGIVALATLLFGRVYCSLLCPLGITQDCIGLLRKRRSFKPMPAVLWLRLLFLAVFTASLLSGYLLIYNLLDPYSSFGRMAASILEPVAIYLNNACSWIASTFFASLQAMQPSFFHGWILLLSGTATLAILIVLVLKAGRIWCNYCPVGTILGFLGYKSLLRLNLDTNKCVSCGLCQKTCKTGCIDIKNARIDNSRCVSCLDCVAVCPKNALGYSRINGGKPVFNESKRAFMRSLPFIAIAPALAMPAQAAGKYKVNRPDVVPDYKDLRPRDTPVTPPGSLGLKHFATHCDGCQLCVAACPNKVLTTTTYGPGIFQPGMTYERGYCRPNCVECGKICPAGAIKPVTVAEKRTIQIGVASVDRDQCIIHRDDVPCSACQRICPQGAISLEKVEGAAYPMPFVDGEKCTGCGACEFICPGRPLAAIAVGGHAIHKRIKNGA